MEGINIHSGSYQLRGFAAVLSNRTCLARQKGTIKKDYPVIIFEVKYPDAQLAYDTLKESDQDTTLMIHILIAKFNQYPFLFDKLEEFGIDWLKKCRHIINNNWKIDSWQGIGEESGFIQCLIKAYRMVEISIYRDNSIEDFYEYAYECGDR